MQSPISEELDNGKHGTQPREKPLHQRVHGFGQGRNRSHQAPQGVQDRPQSPSSVTDLLQHASESEGKLTMDFMAVSFWGKSSRQTSKSGMQPAQANLLRLNEFFVKQEMG